MADSNSACARWVLSILRIVTALLFMEHGGQKLLNYPPGGHTVPWHTLAGVAGILELVGGALELVGFLTRPVAFILSGEMAVAYFMVHAKGGLWPIQNKGELAVLYCFVFLYLAAAGGGPLSVDSLWRGGKKSSA
jgi:putative oxidoreductase